MKEKQIVLQNLGMNRDLSVSKTGESAAFENRNIRIVARDNDTLLSVTNEQGTKEIPLPKIQGKVIGWNVLNNHIILFSREEAAQDKAVLLAMSQNVFVYGDRLAINTDGGKNLSFRLNVYQPIDPLLVSNIVVTYMPADKYEEGKPIIEESGISIRQAVGSTEEGYFSKRITFSGIDGTLLTNGYIVVVEYSYNKIGYDHELDIDTGEWDEDPDNPPQGGGDDGDEDDDIPVPIINAEIDASWTGVDKIVYQFKLKNDGGGNATIKDPILKFKIVSPIEKDQDESDQRPGEGNEETPEQEKEDIYTYYMSNPSSVTLGSGMSYTWNGQITDHIYDSKKSYYISWGDSNKWQQIGLGADFVPPVEETEKLDSILLWPTSLHIKEGEVFDSFVCNAIYVKGQTSREVPVTITQWSSSNEKVATITKDGVLTGVKEGECDIAGTFEGKSVFCSVYVTKEFVRKLTAIQAEVTKSRLSVGEKAELSCRAYYNDDTSEDITSAAQYTIANGSVLSLNGTEITAKAVGSSRITASYSGLESALTVTVRSESSEDDNGGNEYDGTDYIYRIDYVDGNFVMVRGKYSGDSSKDVAGEYQLGAPLFSGNLGFDCKHPIESVVSQESDNLQKIYWVDGKNVLRFMNINQALDENGTLPWDNDPTYFDSNKTIAFTANVSVTKDNAGASRPNGVAQYILTYFNRHGQESGAAWISDLVYLSPATSGGAADGINSNRILFEISNLDTSFSHFRIYLVFRSSLNGEAVTYLVSEQKTSSDTVQVIDDGSHLTLQDTMRIFYLGSQPVIAGTLTHKDDTLFLGDLQSVGIADYTELEKEIRKSMFVGGFVEGKSWESSAIEFVYSNDSSSETSGVKELTDIQYIDNIGNYPYESQLSKSSAQITSFKGGEKYRFALKFKLRNGVETQAFWIGDKENTLYPVIDVNNKVIKRIGVRCTLPTSLIEFLKKKGMQYATVQLLIAEATYSDRSVKAQGFVSPTVFNTWERYNKRIYSMPSWISRPRGSLYAHRHFEPIAKSTSSFSEIQCNYWKEDKEMHPYFQYKQESYGLTYAESFDSDVDYDFIMLVYTLNHTKNALIEYQYTVDVRVVTGKLFEKSAEEDLKNFIFKRDDFSDFNQAYYASANDAQGKWHTYTQYEPGTSIPRFTLNTLRVYARGSAILNHGAARKALYTNMVDKLVNQFDIPEMFVVDYSTFADGTNSWCKRIVNYAGSRSYNDSADPNEGYGEVLTCLNTGGERRWKTVSDRIVTSSTGSKTPSFKKKNLMFVDENIVTLNSPELDYGNFTFDKADYKFRIIGVAKMTSVISDYLVSADNTPPMGEALDKDNFSGNLNELSSDTDENNNRYSVSISGILSWPIWKDYALFLKESNTTEDVSKFTASDYKQGNNIVRYWMYMWNHSGLIGGYTPAEETDTIHTQASLLSKTFANLRFSYNTIYFNNRKELPIDSLRVAEELGAPAYGINVGTEELLHSPRPQLLLTMPGTSKYPLIYSDSRPLDTKSVQGVTSENAFLYTDSPVMLEFTSSTHAVISLHTEHTEGISVRQTVLPRLFSDETIELEAADTAEGISAPIIPWIGSETAQEAYSISQIDWTNFSKNNVNAGSLNEDDQYVFIGEIYNEFGEGASDNRYGGISLNAIESNRFIVAGPAYPIRDMLGDGKDCIYGNQGDTYFQRWDCLKTKAFSSGSVNNVIDIMSVMLETHVNLDGRTDLQRGITEIASLDTAQFGTINRVYSQGNNLSVVRDLDDDFNDDSYRSSITWTLPKQDSADTDEWTHITLASSLKLDSDKGICRALRRFQNSIISFQDRGISEVLFNSKTQLSTEDGVPVEIANSGKVDGKRYITGKHGCINKWSITEGKNGLYFVDSINKAFFTYNGNLDNLSMKLGFDIWFRSNNNTEPWNPVDFNNLVSYYDRVHSDVYLISKGGKGSEYPTLVFNETLGRFTSFFDYDSVTMMANVEDRFVSVYENRLWLQNEGRYCNFFGKQYPFSVQYRVTPNPFSDKIWTNLEYRADFYKVLDSELNRSPLEGYFTDDTNSYQPNVTFDYMRFWNEYQTTAKEGDALYKIQPEKKFRIWRVVIPRAIKTDTNRYGLDRMRNPWLNILLKKNVSDSQSLMQLHDVIVKYFE